ncbi:hypothetical protein PMALA_057800 [Plasmodium malariae]|uniref:Uncharacterized protein n=1 Tax=Plasmodium malariae TaxID=5858 RepID=A0A1A8WZP5_PLAMA|nr:hypothetical protein PMALA_057800 [Plasmodium malariae]
MWYNDNILENSAFDKPLDNINNENRTLGSRTDILLSDSEKEVKNIELNCTLFGNGYYDLENDNNRDESTYDGTYECKKKNNLKTEAKKLAYALIVQMSGDFYELQFQPFTQLMETYGGTDIILLLTLLCISIVIYILVKFLKYAIHVGRNKNIA